jgi:hypothetical protein
VLLPCYRALLLPLLLQRSAAYALLLQRSAAVLLPLLPATEWPATEQRSNGATEWLCCCAPATEWLCYTATEWLCYTATEWLCYTATEWLCCCAPTIYIDTPTNRHTICISLLFICNLHDWRTIRFCGTQYACSFECTFQFCVDSPKLRPQSSLLR